MKACLLITVVGGCALEAKATILRRIRSVTHTASSYLSTWVHAACPFQYAVRYAVYTKMKPKTTC